MTACTILTTLSLNRVVRQRPFALLLLWLLGPIPCVHSASYGTGHAIRFDESDKSVDRRLDLMNKKLDLSPDQQSRVKAALNEEVTKTDLLRKEVQEARKKIAEDTDGTLISILTPRQQEIYQKIKFDIIGKPETPPAAAAPDHKERGTP